jgi:hypothetical protein
MTLEEFVNKYNGKVVDFDGQYGAQCVDLARQYFKDVWNLPKQPESVNGAVDFYFKHENRLIQREYCDCVAYYDTFTPPPSGAVVIFREVKDNPCGHIAICIKADSSSITVLEQDGVYNLNALKEKRPQKPAYITRWGYARLVGWLIKKDVK